MFPRFHFLTFVSNPKSIFRDKMVTVHKFGGTSVAGASQFARVCGIVNNCTSSENPVVVVSAMAGITNQL